MRLVMAGWFSFNTFAFVVLALLTALCLSGTTLVFVSSCAASAVRVRNEAFCLRSRRDGFARPRWSSKPKPIDPDALFECVDAFLDANESISDIEPFLCEPTGDDVQSASQVLWRVRGIATLPKAVVFPAPSAAERQGLSYCFELTDASKADCGVVLNGAGLPSVADLRRSGMLYLVPVFGIGDTKLHACEAQFSVGDPESWSVVAAQLKNVQAREAELHDHLRATQDFDLRLLSYIFVAERPIILRRDSFGRTEVVYAAGFEPEAVLAAFKRLAANGMVASRVKQQAGDELRELYVFLSEAGTAIVSSVAPRFSINLDRGS